MQKDHPGWLWIFTAGAVAILIGFVDLATGYELNFFVFYFLPIAIAAWFAGRGASVSIAVFSALVWFGADFLSGHVHASHFYAVWNTLVRLSAFLGIGWSMSLIRYLVDRERQAAQEQRRLLSEIQVLEAFLPICCQCKKIRDENDEWHQIESYIGAHTGTKFSHGYCPECARKALIEAGLSDADIDARTDRGRP